MYSQHQLDTVFEAMVDLAKEDFQAEWYKMTQESRQAAVARKLVSGLCITQPHPIDLRILAQRIFSTRL